MAKSKSDDETKPKPSFRMVDGQHGSTLARIAFRRDFDDLRTTGKLKLNLMDELPAELKPVGQWIAQRRKG